MNSVIENIIRNAQIHGKTDRINILIEDKHNFIEIRIADQGIGIPSEIKDKLFTEGFFYGETGHTGLGLYIAKKTVNRYGGEISIENNEPKGTVFAIRLQKPTKKGDPKP